MGPVLVPVPVRATVCGLPLALSVMLTAAVRLPVAEGVKVTLIVQLAPAATELPQVLVWAKSLALAPVTARLVMFSVALPVLLTVTLRAVLVVGTGWLPKARLVAERPATGAALPPVPVKFTLCGLPVALSVMLTEAVRVPVAEGVKVKVAGIGARHREAGDGQVCVARVGHSDGLRHTGRTYGLAAEGNAGVTERNARC
jgi:hypothetical protein